MIKREIRWTRRAVRRLDEIGEYISKDSAIAAAQVTQRILSAVEALADLPDMGRVGRIPDTRELVLTDISYIIPYRPGTEYIDILTVMHTRQKWPRLL